MSIHDHIQQLEEKEIGRQQFILDHRDEILELVKELEINFPKKVTNYLLDNHIEDIEILHDVDVYESGNPVYKFIGFDLSKVIDQAYMYDLKCIDDFDIICLDIYMSVWHRANEQKNQRLITFLEQRIRNKYA